MLFCYTFTFTKTSILTFQYPGIGLSKNRKTSGNNCHPSPTTSIQWGLWILYLQVQNLFAQSYILKLSVQHKIVTCTKEISCRKCHAPNIFLHKKVSWTKKSSMHQSFSIHKKCHARKVKYSNCRSSVMYVKSKKHNQGYGQITKYKVQSVFRPDNGPSASTTLHVLQGDWTFWRRSLRE